ncbi:hypothetical protein L1987_79762 [Smallanthus sonchifolius]|uniref:Uncharacterized protein n=1 Tax=Smallanthus sonchifolius TaxID=185202 RepID=A0ACB8YK45_9ASTR|nr:hypothetical protein L1987_79762 [Smallanthus sonchifolius]
MDREQEQMQFLRLFGIFKGSYKIIISWRKIFTQITLTLILPLTFIFLAHLGISNSLFQDIIRYNNLSDTFSPKWITFLPFEAAYITIFLILYLLSTAAVVYTIASVYTGRELTFKEVMSVVPKVWKKLMVTFLCMIAISFVYIFLGALAMFISLFLVPYPLGVTLAFAVLIIYMIGLMYTVCWQLASVVSVLESSCGFKAMAKSKDLIKGNRMVAISVSFLLSLPFFFIKLLFELLVVHGSSLEVWKRVGLGALCSILLLYLFLFGLVIQTVLYLVCKSYHHENIDKEDLSNHLESYLGEYEPLSGEDVKLEQYQV